jgi:hypothetical protein
MSDDSNANNIISSFEGVEKNMPPIQLDAEDDFQDDNLP